ncbi:methionine ABC transporter permease [Jeotgalicoccus meleagridis]|uniref:Methionine import system permease protein MetP n=1 Tax=Jeotgalicoccus meleagridis TaxID=2759181 RepID=A0A6V7RDH2_9STAP|nr:methionine ABC transporter permease [Jeotgalicoccus meleagridis]CAD2075520.1 Methionine import system permease protein MetP [Jeotgalicoccus meleagridis]HIW39164.1 ABC transporter permease [Candidatus Jeotgalicoccus stercoravium]
MIDGFIVYIDNVVSYLPKFIDSINETGIMMAFAMVAAIILGLPVGTLLFLTDKGQELENKYLYFITNALVNIIRSFPFLLLVIAMQPLIREIYGRATGDPIAASFPLMVIAIALYSRFVQQSLLDVPKGVIETAKAMGASIPQLVFKFLFVEARSSLIIGFTTAFVSFISYSTIMGVVGGGGIGDFAIRYGYQRYETDIMYTAIVIIIIFVQVAQWFGFKLAKKLDKR